MKTSLRRREVYYILKHGERYTCDGFVFFVVRSTVDFGKFTIVIPKKTIKSATSRNRLRRMLREEVLCSGSGFGNFVIWCNNKKMSSKEVRECLRVFLNGFSSIK